MPLLYVGSTQLGMFSLLRAVTYFLSAVECYDREDLGRSRTPLTSSKSRIQTTTFPKWRLTVTVFVAFEVGLERTVVLIFACNGIKIVILSCVVSFFFKVM